MKKEQMKRIIIGVICTVILIVGQYPLTVGAAAGKNMTWSKVSRESESGNLVDVTYNKEKVYVAVGDEGTILRSDNGSDWKRIKLQTSANLKAIVANGNEFVAVGSNGIILNSKDGGKSWSKASVKFGKELNYQTITNKIQKYADKDYIINWKKQPKQREIEFRDVIWDGKQYVAIGHWEVYTGSLRAGSYATDNQTHLYSDFVITSKDGKKWSAVYNGMENIETIIYTGERYLITSKSQIGLSPDLKKWKITTPKVRGDITEIIYVNGKYLMINWDGSLSSLGAAVHTSKDGIKWKSVVNPANIGSLTHQVDDTIKKYGEANGFANLDMRTVIWDGSQYVIAGYKGMILTSKKGTNWVKLNNRWNVDITLWGFTDGAGATTNINKMIYDGEQYIQVGNNGTILVTKNLMEGTIVRERVSADFTNIVYDGKSRYFSYGSEEGVLESTDGYSWTTVNLGETKSITTETIVANQGKAILVCKTKDDDANCFYYYSDKAGNWKKMNFPGSFTYTYGSVYLEGRFHIFTREGLITSEDGKKWSGYKLKNTMLQHIVTNGKIYVGIRATNQGEISAGTLYTATSYKKWNRVNIKKEGKSYYLSAVNVVWNGKEFITIGGKLHKNSLYSDEYVVATSRDGKKWTVKESTDDFTSGTYGNKTFVAFDYSGDLFLSTDGIHYIKSDKSTNQKLTNGIWDGKKFIVVGDMGVILVSSNGKSVTLLKQNKWIEKQSEYSIHY